MSQSHTKKSPKWKGVIKLLSEKMDMATITEDLHTQGIKAMVYQMKSSRSTLYQVKLSPEKRVKLFNMNRLSNGPLQCYRC